MNATPSDPTITATDLRKLALQVRVLGQSSLADEASPERERQQTAGLLKMIGALIYALPSEMVEELFQFILYPRFLPAYQWEVRNTQTGEGVFRAIPNSVRKDLAILEIRRLAAAYGELLRASKQWHAVATSKYLQLALYRRWFQTPPQPYWESVPIHPSSKIKALKQVYQAPGFDRDFLVHGIFSKSIPELDDHAPPQPGWYSIFLANLLWNFDFGETLRGEMKRDYVMNTAPDRQQGIFVYDGLRISEKQLDAKTWDRITSATIARIEIFADRTQKLVRVANKSGFDAVPVIDQRKNRRLNLAAWIQPHVRNQDKYHDKDWYPDLSDFDKMIARALAAISVIRVPTVILLHDSTKRTRVASFFIRASGQRWVWDPALRLNPTVVNAIRHPRFTFWPVKGSFAMSGCVLASTQRSRVALSTVLAMENNNRVDFGSVIRSTLDVPLGLDLFRSGYFQVKVYKGQVAEKYGRPQDVPIYTQPLTNTQWIDSVVRHFITSPETIPDYLKDYTSQRIQRTIEAWE